MLKEQSSNLKIVKTLSDTKKSYVGLLDDGRVVKILSKLQLELYLNLGILIEEKLAYSENLSELSWLYKPESLVFNGNICVGYTQEHNNNINYEKYRSKLSFQEQCDLYEYADKYSKIETIVKEGNNAGLVFPDLCTLGNLYIDENGNFSMIDYDDLQIDRYLSLYQSTSLGNQKNHDSPKFINGLLYTPELDKKSLLFLYFIDAFSMDLYHIGEYSQTLKRKITVKDAFLQLGLDDYKLMRKIDNILSSTQKGDFLGKDVYRIASRYQMRLEECSDGQTIKRLVRINN